MSFRTYDYEKSGEISRQLQKSAFHGWQHLFKEYEGIRPGGKAVIGKEIVPELI